MKYQKRTDSCHSYLIRSEYNEITKSRIIYQLKESLQNHKFFMCTDHDQITSDLTFIKKFVSQISELVLTAYGLNSNDMEELKYVLIVSNIKVSFVA